MKRISDSRYLLDHYQKYHLVDKFTPEIALPKEGYNIVKFDISDKHCFLKTKRKKFVCYADFETLSKITTEELKKAGKSSKEIQQVVQQLPYAYAIFCPDLADLKGQTKKGKPIKLSESTYLKFGIDSDPDKLLRKFIDDLDIIYSCCLLRLDQHKDIPELTPDQYNAYYNATNCECCGFPFDFPEHQNGPKMRHHDHVTGEYIGAWCRRCNFNEGERFKLTVMFHNFRSYDSHFIIRYGLKYLQERAERARTDGTGRLNTQSDSSPKRGRDDKSGKHLKPKSIKQFAITKSSEKFSQLVFGNYEFMDTFLHLNTSLDNLVEQLRRSNHEFPISNRVKLEKCLRQKGIFPHSYITSFDKHNDNSYHPLKHSTMISLINHAMKKTTPELNPFGTP
jgi:hypothetical protein